MSTKIILIRHAESNANKDFLSSDSFTRLSKNGIKQARLLSKNQIFKDLDVIYTSPLTRAVETSNIIATNNPHLKIIKTDLIKEKRGASRFNLKKRSELPWDLIIKERRDPDWHFEDGESFSDVKKRIKKFLRIIEKLPENSNVLLVTHGSFIRHFTFYMLLGTKFDPSLFYLISDRMETTNTGITVFERRQKYYENKPSWYLLTWMSK